ncbi:MAG: N-acetyl-gamma-glutamyl-phosphate reductase [Deltaproteobacteria bacterium]|nr:N-acetyl-gamma-glutamyl-phosphate reductase [Deltaproteobacteria bacterium]
MTKRFKAAVIGGSGYGGGEMIRRLLLHPEVELTRVASIDYVGKPLSAAHPNLEGRSDLVFEDLTPAQAAEGVDVVLLGLPHKIAAHKMPELIEAGVRVVDLSGDFRLKDVAAYQRYYQAHPHPELLGRFVYGLPELNREQIKASRHVASPGCFATTIELGLLPLARQGWLQGPVQTVAMTGSSGSGVAASAGTHHPVRSVNLKTYKTLDHQHTPEIIETLNNAGARELALHFIPVSAPLSRGLFASSFAYVDAAIEPDVIKAAFAATYAAEPFVRVPQGRLPEVAAVAGSNHAEVGCVVGEVVGDKRLVTCFTALDNLIKGGAGQGIQNMNLILGLDERLSLEDPGSWP